MPATDNVNIGGKERLLRLILGIVFIILAVPFSLWLLDASQPGLWFILYFIVVYQGVRFVFDYQSGTCPLKAELGQQKLDGILTILGSPIDDTERAGRIRDKSIKALPWSFGIAALLTLAVAFARG